MSRIATRIHLFCLFAATPLAVFFSDSGELIWTHGLGIYVWVLYLAGLCLGFPALPQGRYGKASLLGLVGLTAFTGASILWAPDRGPALGNFTQLILYSGAALAFTSALTRPQRKMFAEPIAWATALAGCLYGLSERLAPGVISLPHDRIAFGRLAEPLGYWNAMGALAGIGLVLAARLAADRQRSAAVRASAIASAPILSAALWLTFSRGALVATAAGLATLVALRFSRLQLRSVLITAATLLPVSFAEDRLVGVRTLAGSQHSREMDGLVLAIVILATSALAVAAQSRLAKPEKASDARRIWALGGLPAVLAVLLALAPAGIVLLGSGNASPPVAPSGADAQRLQSIDTNRSHYWTVALDGFADRPIEGQGSGSFRAQWLQHREGRQPALNAHSLEVETLGELGIAGFLLLLVFIVAAFAKAVSVHRRQPGLLIGAMGAGVVYLSHSSVDWDLQVPGVTMVALLLLSAVLADQPPLKTAEPSARSRLVLIGACAIGISASIWLGHLWEATELQLQARSKRDAAQILGWTPVRYRQTVSLLKQAQWLNPAPGPSTDLASVYWQSGHPKLAADEVRAIIRDNPGWWLAWQVLWTYRTAVPLAEALDAKTRSQRLRGITAPWGN